MTRRSRADVENKLENERRDHVLQGRYGRSLETLDRMSFHAYTGEVEIHSVRVRLGILDQLESLCVVIGTNADGLPVVGFNSALSPGEALMGALNRIENGQMKWKEDEYRNR